MMFLAGSVFEAVSLVHRCLASTAMAKNSRTGNGEIQGSLHCAAQ
jgi:hypothetical protein